jgi:hypothetical protein
VRTRPLRSLPRQADYGHGAEWERGVLDALAARIDDSDGLLGGEAGVGARRRRTPASQPSGRSGSQVGRRLKGVGIKLLLRNGCGGRTGMDGLFFDKHTDMCRA